MRQTKFFAFEGGENLVDPVMMMKPGELHDSMNYECLPNRGYRRVDGFERFDGQQSPSELLKSDYADLNAWELAVDAARALIQPLPGSGPVRGVWSFNGDTYGFRDNLGATACVMHKATASGWVAVPMNYRLDFTAGTSEIIPGDVITGAVSGATATVCKIFVASGDWGTNDAAGRLCFDPATLTGNFQAGELIKVSSVNSATNTAPEYAMFFPPGGRYDFINHNFYATASGLHMFGANGVGNAFVFDGTDLWFVETGMPEDKPSHVFAHKDHLFLSYEGGSIQHSSPGDPENFQGVQDAVEIGLGDNCTGFARVPGGILALFGRNRIALLYGTNALNWELKEYSIDSGAIDFSVQSMDVPYFLDDRGLKKLATTTDYGDFSMNTLSQKVKPALDSKLGHLSCSLRVRSKDQYRLFFDDGSVLIFALASGNVKGITRANYGYWDTNNEFQTKIFVTAVSTEDSEGREILYTGDGEGYVYKLDKGSSFDGQEVLAYIRPVFYHFGSPENIKRFMKVVLELETLQALDMTFTPEFSYGDPGLPVAYTSDIDVTAGAGIWDESYWEAFYWDSQSLSTAYGYMTGIGKNFRMVIKSLCKYETPHTLQGATIHFTRKGYAK